MIHSSLLGLVVVAQTDRPLTPSRAGLSMIPFLPTRVVEDGSKPSSLLAMELSALAHRRTLRSLIVAVAQSIVCEFRRTRTLICRNALGAVTVTMLLAGCEEMVPPAAGAAPAAPLYTEIAAAELLERWSILPGGIVAEGANLTRGRRLAVTEGFSVLPFRFSEVRKYGSCVVFTVEYDSVWTDETGATQTHTETYHFIDCVGSSHKNRIGGLFHAANFCLRGGSYVTILRGGHFDPDTHVHEVRDFHDEWVHARIADHADSFQWHKHVTPTAGGAPVLVNWAVGTSGEYYEGDTLVHSWGAGTAGFDSLHRLRQLHFQIDHSIGVVKVEANDGAAFTEFQRRCGSLTAVSN